MTDLEGRDDMFKNESCRDDRQPPSEPVPTSKPQPQPPATGWLVADEEPDHWFPEISTLD